MTTTGPPALDASPRRWRALASAAPWLLAAGLLVVGVARGPAAAMSDGATGAGPPELSAPVASPPPQPAMVLPSSVQAQVVLAARRVLGSAGLVPDHAVDRWALDLLVVDVTAVGASLAVATVHGSVITRDANGWTGLVPAAATVPLHLLPYPAVAGPAWPATAPVLAPVSLPRVAVDEPAALDEVVAALQRAGWVVADVITAAAVDDVVLEVDILATAPSASQSTTHTVWLRREADGVHLLPHPTTSTPTTTEETP